MIFLDGRRDVLQQHRLTRPWRRNDQGALALTNWRNNIDDAAGTILAGRILAFHAQALFGIQRCKVVEVDLLVGLVRFLEIDAGHIGQREVALIILRRDDWAFHRIAGANVALLQNFRADINIVRSWQIVGFRRAQETEPISQNFEHALARDFYFTVGKLFEDREQHVLRPHGRSVLDFQLFCIGKQFLGRLRLEIAEFHAGDVVEHGRCHE